MKILSIAQNVPGPVAVARLVAGGASAIKVEPPSGDPLERHCKPWYDKLQAGVQVLRLDLKSSSGMNELKALLATRDVFIAGQRPAALTRLGLDAEALARDFPALRHLNIVGDTAEPEKAGHDLTYLARAGLLQGGLPPTLLADMIGADRAHAAVLGLMLEGPGSRRVIGLFDGVSELAEPLRQGLTAPGGLLGGANPAYAVYRAKEGSVAVAALEPHFRARLYESVGLADGADLTGTFATRTAGEWERWAAERDIPLVAVRVF